jgi:short-chain fatty acids transporter
MLRLDRIGLRISSVFERTVPDPFVIAILLTLFTAAITLAFGRWPNVPEGGSTLLSLLDSWRGDGGIWAFLAFSMQMSLILVTGYALAESRPVRALIDALVTVPRTTAQAVFLVGLVAGALGLINWGLGLVAGALIARDAGRSLHGRGIRAHYPLIVAAGYLGMLVWHGGLSGTAPLKSSTARELIDTFYRARPDVGLVELARLGVADGVSLGATLATPMNLLITGVLVVGIPALLMLFAPRNERDISDVTKAAVARNASRLASGIDDIASRGVPDRLFTSPTVAWLLAVPLLAGFVRYGTTDGLGQLGPNEIVMLMLAVGLICHNSLRSYAASAEDGARACAGIILQFPLYAGIMAMLRDSGMIADISNWFVRAGSETTIPLMTFLSAGLVNLFVPSGGGQWGIQGLIALQAAHEAGIDPGKMIMSVAYGDQLTNMLQPFWALPLLGITGVKARDIVGYTAIAMLAAGVWIGMCLLVF